MGLRSRIAAISLVLAVAAGSYTAGTIGAQQEQPAAKSSLAQMICKPEPVHQAIYGDSITSWKPAFNRDWRQSWVYWASSNEFPASYGWSYPGATLAQMAVNATNSPAQVVQIMGGTNDLPINAPGVVKAGTPKAQMLASIDRIVAVEKPERVVLLAVPPFGWNYAESNTWNAELRAHAEAQGWDFVDPWVGMRDPSGAWWPGLSNDAVHPSPLYTWAPGQAIYAHLNSMLVG